MTDNQMLQAIASSISLLRKEMQDGFKKVDQKFEEVYERINNLDEKFTLRWDSQEKSTSL